MDSASARSNGDFEHDLGGLVERRKPNRLEHVGDALFEDALIGDRFGDQRDGVRSSRGRDVQLKDVVGGFVAVELLGSVASRELGRLRGDVLANLIVREGRLGRRRRGVGSFALPAAGTEREGEGDSETSPCGAGGAACGH